MKTNSFTASLLLLRVLAKINIRPRFSYFSWLLLFITYCLTGQSSIAQTSISVGVSERDITPNLSIKNWITGKPYSKLNDPLKVRTVLLKTGTIQTVLVSFDLVDAGESLTDEIRTLISGTLQIPKNHILVTATHTHSAPWAPVYKAGYRGKENDTWWATRYMPAQNTMAPFKQWMQLLLDQTKASVLEAKNNLQSATMWIGKADISAFALNRRPIQPTWGTIKSSTPTGYNYKHGNYAPEVNTEAANYGPLDRTMSLVSFRNGAGENIVSLYHLSIHPVAIYPYSDEISADWPGEATKQLEQTLGGKAVFLQGTTGDINPWRRGREAVNILGKGIAERGKASFDLSVQIAPDTLRVQNSKVGLPLDALGQKRTGLETIPAEIQVITLGPIAFVTLPGEPLTELGVSIRQRSPYPHTLVMGYSNGNGVHYSGMPYEKARGGYEMLDGTIGTEEAGVLMIETATRLLQNTYHKQRNTKTN